MGFHIDGGVGFSPQETKHFGIVDELSVQPCVGFPSRTVDVQSIAIDPFSARLVTIHTVASGNDARFLEGKRFVVDAVKPTWQPATDSTPNPGSLSPIDPSLPSGSLPDGAPRGQRQLSRMR